MAARKSRSTRIYISITRWMRASARGKPLIMWIAPVVSDRDGAREGCLVGTYSLLPRENGDYYARLERVHVCTYTYTRMHTYSRPANYKPKSASRDMLYAPRRRIAQATQGDYSFSAREISRVSVNASLIPMTQIIIFIYMRNSLRSSECMNVRGPS